MITIHLDNLEFFAHHGLHDEEAVIGTTFRVSIAVICDPGGKITSIHQTVNYVDIYNVISEHMKHPVALLEMLAQNIADDIAAIDHRIRNINIQINKTHPPIRNFIGEVGVSFQKSIDV